MSHLANLPKSIEIALQGGTKKLRDSGADLLILSSAIPLPVELKVPFLVDVLTWCKNSGTEWATTRLKNLYTDLVRMRAGETPTSVWVQKDKSSGYPKGSLKPLFRLGIEGSEKQFYHVSCLLRCYTLFRGPTKPTQKQLQKFTSGVLAEPTPCLTYNEGVLEAGRRAVRGFGSFTIPRPEPFIYSSFSPSRKAPGGPNGSIPEVEALSISVREIFRPKKLVIRQQSSLPDGGPIGCSGCTDWIVLGRFIV
jgi:hypothetical protein